MAKGDKPLGDVVAVFKRPDGTTDTMTTGTAWLSEKANLTWEQTTVPLAWINDPKQPRRFYMRLREGAAASLLGAKGDSSDGGY